jgi:hypothetical protein
MISIKITSLSLKVLFAITLPLLFFISCKKDKNACWQAYDVFGIEVTGLVICDKTQSEAEAAYPRYLFCNAAEAKYCWRVQQANGGIFYTGSMPQSIADKMWLRYGYTYTKFDCNNICQWKIFEKSKSKITGSFQPVTQYIETYTTDTCTKLFVGRIITIRETADSLITREYAEKLRY